jgi:ubiquinone/menaquinone biosynthesis C-methylase UbiE
VQNESLTDELERLRIQDQFLTIGLGGVLPEVPEPGRLRSVLDIGCGTGNWLVEVAKAYPTIARLVGVDISERMVQYARTQAEVARVGDRVTFQEMDVRRMLKFPAASFDLVNQRLGASYLRTWDWPELLHEYQRVLRPGGTVRITEGDIIGESTSPALRRLQELTLDAAYNAGNFFTHQGNGVTSQLARLLHQYGFVPIKTHAYRLTYRPGTPQGQRYFENMKLAFRNLVPYFQKWTQLPPDYEQLYQQALVEMQQPDFEVNWTLLTALGTNPPE